ncbi:MAG: D-lyxose/D-mannose family sugar isomerase [Candidatus Aminicenantes bacterium]|nr:D-lyxose/D-mannose family sugar isomerase [Candidatus Aminicenantes bacterium]
MHREDAARARHRAAAMLKKAGIVLTPAEEDGMEVADFGLGRLDRYGLEIVTYVNNGRYCAKELVLFPGQTCPEHIHPPLGPDNPGKQETFRCRFGTIYLHIPGESTPESMAKIRAEDKANFTAAREVVLRPGDQVTIPPEIRHWFQAGSDGAVVSEFSSTSVDAEDIFTDPRIRRVPVYD